MLLERFYEFVSIKNDQEYIEKREFELFFANRKLIELKIILKSIVENFTLKCIHNLRIIKYLCGTSENFNSFFIVQL